MRTALACLALVACNAEDVAKLDIPCTTDDECPTGEWCDTSGDSCNGRNAPPHLTFGGLGDNGRIAVTAKTHSYTPYRLQVHNDGGGQVELHVGADGPACLDATVGRADAGYLDRGRDAELDLGVDPDPGCASPSSFTVTVDASGRKFAVSYDVTITP